MELAFVALFVCCRCAFGYRVDDEQSRTHVVLPATLGSSALVDVNLTEIPAGQEIVNQMPGIQDFVGDASVGIAAAGTASLLGSFITGTHGEITNADVLNQAAAWVPAVVALYNPLVGFSLGLAFALLQGLTQSAPPKMKDLFDKAFAAYSIKLANDEIRTDSNSFGAQLQWASNELSTQLRFKNRSDVTRDAKPLSFWHGIFFTIRTHIHRAITEVVSKGNIYDAKNKGIGQLYRASMFPLMIQAWNLHSSVLLEQILIQTTPEMRKDYATLAEKLAAEIGTFITQAAEDTWQVERRHLHSMGWGDPLNARESPFLGDNCTVKSTTKCTHAFRPNDWCEDQKCKLNAEEVLYRSSNEPRPCSYGKIKDKGVCRASQLKVLLDQAKLKASELKIMAEAITAISNPDFHPHDWLCENSNMKKEPQTSLVLILKSGNWQLMSCLIRVQTRKWLDKWDQKQLQALAKKLLITSPTIQDVIKAGGERASDSQPKMVEMNPHETYLFEGKASKGVCNGQGYIINSCSQDSPDGRHVAGSRQACIQLCDAYPGCFGIEYWRDGGCYFLAFGAELQDRGWFERNLQRNLDGVYRMDQKDDGFEEREAV